ncbi:SAM-dependent methyltransferase [Actinosynnema sp. ALI-1.44]|uniref:class I SAM-dependent methyltransferase n=1 Tax=Actinosynnema sp. ALI-1.44 TaxID=1933779 RepID=UPI00097C7015|nr:class I SAM-dependent methyltransferase [Actinosynnema sp. ALI-1.44]ONI72847.1 SAM-dependent methyltransferase [Actinosynnema sp. ALI-1.44]
MDSVTINKAHWDERAPAHAASADYGIARFLADPAHLSAVVRFDKPRLGPIDGLRGVHLQCHIGTDTLSLARLGAHMTGLDFSPAALAEARKQTEAAGAEIPFHESDVHDAVDVLGAESFDLVYTGVGALCWLPSVSRWAQVVSSLLRPGGRLFIREGHPMLWGIDETAPVPYPHYSYFEQAEPMVFDEDSTYVTTDVSFHNGLSHSWNHGMAEIITALMDNGLRLTQFVEHDSVPWNAVPGHMTLDPATEEWSFTENRSRVACSYTLQAVKQ